MHMLVSYQIIYGNEAQGGQKPALERVYHAWIFGHGKASFHKPGSFRRYERS